ncbi:hypothetical protein C8R46DRAFT_1343853 [Mycena filopes]|nr:hypothetical protein C8R46DRAFT_1343853 [Mycena filopes]
MQFDQLDADVLIHIFHLTDVYTILSLSRVSKYLRGISSTKHLWLLVVRDLARRGLIGPSDSWEDLSTDELVEEPPSGDKSRLLLNAMQEAPRSSYMGANMIWTWCSSTHRVRHVKLDFSCGEYNPRAALLCAPFTASDRRRLVILDVDLKTGDSSEMLLFDFPHLGDGFGLPRSPQISGFIFACDLSLRSGLTMLLLNWSVPKFILLTVAPPRRQATALFALIPGYIVMTVPMSTSNLENICIYSLVSLEHIWRPLDVLNLNHPMLLDEIIPRISVLPSAPSTVMYHLFADISVLESPVRDGTYTLVVKSRELRTRDLAPSLLVRLRDRIAGPPSETSSWMDTRSLYRLCLPTSLDLVFRPPTLMSAFRWQAVNSWAFTSIAGSGYGIRWDAESEGPNHRERIIFQRLQEGAFKHPQTLATAVEGDVHDTHSMAMRMSDTGIVMLCYAKQLVLYCDSWESLSKDELVEEMRRASVGPRTWNRAAAMIQREITIALDHESGHNGEFLHGGKYILFTLEYGHRGLECWQVLPLRRVWIWHSSTHFVKNANFDFCRGESKAMVSLLCVPFSGLHTAQMVVLDVDLETGNSSEEFSFDTPTIHLSQPRLGRIETRTDFFACTVYSPSRWSLLLVNWPVRKFILLSRGMPSPSCAFIPGHVIFTVSIVTTPENIYVYPLAESLQHLWRPLDALDLDDDTSLQGITPITLQPPPPPIAYTRYYQFAEDLIPKDPVLPTPSLLGRLRARSKKPPPPSNIWVDTRTHYRLTLPAGSDSVGLLQTTLTSTFRWPAKAGWRFEPVSASGYGFWRAKNYVDRIAFQRMQAGVIEDPLLSPAGDEGTTLDAHATTVQMSDTGIVMLRYASRAVVLYWYT